MLGYSLLMMKAKHIILGSALVSLVYTGGKLLANTKRNLTHNLKFRVPFEKIGMKIHFSQTLIQATLEVKNNYYQSIVVEGVNMSVYMKNPQTGTLSELASTQPSPKKYLIARNSTTNIHDIKIDVDNFTLLKNGVSNLLNYQKGSKLFKIIISGYANGFPFNTEIWY